MKALCSSSFPAQDEKLFFFLKQHTNAVIHITAAASFARQIHYDREQQNNMDALIFSNYLFLRVFITVTSDIKRCYLTVRYIHYHLCSAETRKKSVGARTELKHSVTGYLYFSVSS